MKKTINKTEAEVNKYFKLQIIENAVYSALTNPVYLNDINGTFTAESLGKFAMIELLRNNNPEVTSKMSTEAYTGKSTQDAQKWNYYESIATTFAQKALEA